MEEPYKTHEVIGNVYKVLQNGAFLNTLVHCFRTKCSLLELSLDSENKKEMRIFSNNDLASFTASRQYIIVVIYYFRHQYVILLTPDTTVDPKVDIWEFPAKRINPRVIDRRNTSVLSCTVKPVQHTLSSMEIKSLANGPQSFDEA